MNHEDAMRKKKDEGRCSECGHDLKYHDQYGCWGAFPNGTDDIDPEEVFYGECHCGVRPKR